MSPNTVATRVTELAANVEKQLLVMAKNFETFSIALDESTDVSGTAQCAVFIRGVDCSLNATEEFLELTSLKSSTTGRDVFLALENCMKNMASHGITLYVWPLTVHQQCVPVM